MLLQVDVESLIKNKVTIDQFLIASLIYEKNFELLSNYLDLYSSSELKVLFLGLIRAGLIKNNNEQDDVYDFNKFEVRPEFIRILVQGDFFDEIVQTYPQFITRPNGSKDYLRVDLNRCRKAYSKITGNKYMIHQNILNCLQFEVALRRKENSLSYMKRLPKWLTSEEWKSYEQRIKDEQILNLEFGNTKEGGLGYGNKLE